MKSCVVAFLVSLASWAYAAKGSFDSNTQNLEVETNVGTFRGSLLTSFSGKKYAAFQGIPYALAPVRDLRFAKPHPHPAFKGVFDATQPGPACLQPQGMDIVSAEDCLYLNVFTPLFSGVPKSKHKVLVYIHGGGFFIGSGNDYIPGDLVTQESVIVVTMNYRLSWLGFLKGNTSLLPGNQGLWDQLVALTWVKDNIAAFGGDGDDVTLAGNSVGGESVSVWGIVPHGKNLFTKGFLSSGTMFSIPSTPGSSDILLDLLLDRVGCWPSGTEALTSRSTLTFDSVTFDEVVQCLRDLPTEKFVLPVEGSLTNKFCSIDGELFRAAIPELLKDTRYLDQVGFLSKDFIVSLVNHEGATISRGLFTWEKGADNDAQFLSRKARIPLPLVDRVFEWYEDNKAVRFHRIDDIWTDVIMMIPSFEFLDTHTRAVDHQLVGGKQRGKAYFLLMDLFPQYMPNPDDGTYHTMDMAYLFDMTPKEVLDVCFHTKNNAEFSDEDWQLKRKFISLIADFMKHGEPSHTLQQSTDTSWPAYTQQDQQYLRFGHLTTVEQFPLRVPRHFWAQVYPAWLEELKKSRDRDEL